MHLGMVLYDEQVKHEEQQRIVIYQPQTDNDGGLFISTLATSKKQVELRHTPMRVANQTLFRSESRSESMPVLRNSILMCMTVLPQSEIAQV